jgi:hypothetical protein
MILRQTQNNKEARLFIKQILIDKIEKKKSIKKAMKKKQLHELGLNST